MDYNDFKKCLLDGLNCHYGDGAVIAVESILKNNGKRYEGIRIVINSIEPSIVPIINMEDIYETYRSGGLDMKGCVVEVCRMREEHEYSENIRKFAGNITDWRYAKRKVYPILLSTEENMDLLQNLVSMPLLDLTVAYIIRENLSGGGERCVKVNKALLKCYGIGLKELHGQAMKNMGQDGYRFKDIADLLKDMPLPSGVGKEMLPWETIGQQKMYVLTNSSTMYGAAGILDRELVRKFARGRSFYILPSSIHETIFVPADNWHNRDMLDKMVSEINETQVDKEERLSNHSYFYDGGTDEIGMWN